MNWASKLSMKTSLRDGSTAVSGLKEGTGIKDYGWRTMKIGKIDSELLEKIVFKNIRFRRPEVVTRPGIGEDCAVVEFGDYDCVLSTDPITGAVGDIGRLAVHISCNDIASNGIEPPRDPAGLHAAGGVRQRKRSNA